MVGPLLHIDTGDRQLKFCILVAHTACPISDSSSHTDSKPVRPRESIEVRALVLYGGFEPDGEAGKQ